MTDFKLAPMPFGGESRSTSLTTKSLNLLKEKSISEFEIITKIGQGSFGTVFKVRDTFTGRSKLKSKFLCTPITHEI